MNDNELIDNPHFNKKLDQVHQQLLMDEEFQNIRTSILQSLNKEKQHFLHENDRDYIKDHQIPPRLEQQISRQYQDWVKDIPKHHKKSFFDDFFQKLSFNNNFSISLPNMGFVMAGLMIGFVLAPQWRALYQDDSVAKETKYIAYNGVLNQSKVNQINHEKTEPMLANLEKLLAKGDVSNAQHQIQTTRIRIAKLEALLQKKVKQGNKKVQRLLGWMYEQGYQVEQNDEQAVKFYTLAAKQGERLAQNNLAKMYFNGWGVKKDREKALYWYQQSALQNYAEAQYNLAMLYQNSFRNPKMNLAHKWLKEAAKQGHKRAQFSLNQNSLWP